MVPLPIFLPTALTHHEQIALSIALRHGSDRPITATELQHAEQEIARSLTHQRSLMYTAAGDLFGHLDSEPASDMPCPSGGTHSAASVDILQRQMRAQVVYLLRPIPDFVAGYILARDTPGAYSLGHLPEKLTANEIARLRAASKCSILDGSDAHADGLVKQAAHVRRITFGFGEVLRGEAVIQVTEAGKLRFIPLHRLSVEQEAAYADAREQAGLVPLVADPPLSRSDFERLGEAVECVTEDNCDGHLTRVMKHLEDHGLPVVPMYQSFMRIEVFCDCLAAKAYRYAPIGDMWLDSEAEAPRKPE